METIPKLERPPERRTARGDATRRRILEVALDVFAEKGYAHARLEDVAARIGLSRPGILKHFRSKERLFVETYKLAMEQLPTWFSAPQEVIDQGFFEILRYWLRCSTRERPDTIPYRIYYLGRFCSDMSVHRAITAFMRAEDPERTLEFVEFGMDKGEIASDLSPYLVAAFIDWVIDGFESSRFADEFDRGGIFRRGPACAERSERAIHDMIDVLRRALGPRDGARS
jgi:AcrR family transcriptional regulator